MEGPHTSLTVRGTTTELSTETFELSRGICLGRQKAEAHIPFLGFSLGGRDGQLLPVGLVCSCKNEEV